MRRSAGSVALTAIFLTQLSFIVASVEGEAKDLLPDLIVRPSDLLVRQYDTTVVPGRLYLRFSNGTANVGEGILELQGIYPPNPDSTVTVNQRIYRDVPVNDSSYWERECGSFEYHPSHGHTHFGDWATYRIRRIAADGGVGEILAEGTKISFCILDESVYDSTIAGYSGRHFFGCDPTVQGLSIGCIDVYDYYRAEQWLDVTDIPHGRYWLESIVDPVDRILELNENNNEARVKVLLCNGVAPTIGVDSMWIDSVESLPDGLIRVDVRAENSIPIHALTVAFTYDGALDLALETASIAEARTTNFEYAHLVSFDPFAKSAAYLLQSSTTDSIPNELPPGSGVVLSLYFSAPPSAAGSNPVSFTSVNGYSPSFSTLCLDYAPDVATSGAIVIPPPCCAVAGDADGTSDVSILDAVFVLDYIFAGGVAPSCMDAGDADGSNALDIVDVTTMITYIFDNGSALVCGNTRR